jgi:hypothetical protein
VQAPTNRSIVVEQLVARLELLGRFIRGLMQQGRA